MFFSTFFRSIINLSGSFMFLCPRKWIIFTYSSTSYSLACPEVIVASAFSTKCSEKVCERASICCMTVSSMNLDWFPTKTLILSQDYLS